MLLAPQLAEEGGGGIGALGIDPAGLLVYLVNFGILLLVLYILAYKPFLRMMDSRRQRIQEGVEASQRAQEESARTREEMRKQMEESRREAQQLIQQSEQRAERYRQEEEQRARQRAEELLQQAREDIQRERDEAIEEVRRHFGDLAILAAERIVERSLDRQSHSDVIDRVLAESPSPRRS